MKRKREESKAVDDQSGRSSNSKHKLKGKKNRVHVEEIQQNEITQIETDVQGHLLDNNHDYDSFKHKLKRKKKKIITEEIQNNQDTNTGIKVQSVENSTSKRNVRDRIQNKKRNISIENTVKEFQKTEDTKRKKHVKRKKSKKNKVHTQKSCNEENKEKSVNYLKQWQRDRQNWKFEKLRQIWLLKNMFCTSNVSTDH